MKNKMIPMILMIIFIIVSFSACTKNEIEKTDSVTTIKFNDNFKYQLFDGKEIKIRGYMSTLSPLDGKFMYLMNIPYQNCPFCLPNTSTVVNTIAVYAQPGQKFDFYDGPIEIIGTVEVGAIVDEFGYEYKFRIINAEYCKIDTNELSENLKIYGALSQDGIISEIINITNQVDFNAFFEMYHGTVDKIIIVNDQDFDNIIRKINAVSKTDFVEIIEIVENFKEFNKTVNINIDMEEYEKNCTIDMDTEIVDLLNSLYDWINKFEI